MRIHKLKGGFKKLTKEKARIIAHLIGDGAHYKTKHDYVMKYEVRDEESLNQFSNDFLETYGLHSKREMNKSGITGKPIPFVRVRAKRAYEDLLRYATYFSADWHIKSPILNASKSIKRQFLRALYDDEGSIRNRYEIVLYSINHKGLVQIKDMLREFGVDSKFNSGFGKNRNVYGLCVRDISQFNNNIGFGLNRKQEKVQIIIQNRSLK